MQKFFSLLETYYTENKRKHLPWRKTKNLYHILLSEIMLQQTQVSRVLVKYKEFLSLFPDLQTLSEAPLRDVLIAWQGLGYNRRAKFLHETSKILVTEKNITYKFLNSLPGIGQSTAGAVLAFTKNKPVVFIETNIRTVILHHFFKDATEKVSDKEITLILEKLLVKTSLSPRDFYYAMYDYGTFLKTSLGKEKNTLHSKSKHYVKQSVFTGSRRQLRAYILKTFLEIKNQKHLLEKVQIQLPKSLKKYSAEDITRIIDNLKNEGFFK